MPFDDDLPHAIASITSLTGCELPEKERPSFLTLYFTRRRRRRSQSRARFTGRSRCGRSRRSIHRRSLVAGVKQSWPRRSRALRRRQRSRHGGAQPRSHDRARRLHRRRPPSTWSTGRRCWRCRRRTATSTSSMRRSRTSIRRSMSIAPTRFPRCTDWPGIRACRRSSAIAKEGWFITSKREDQRWARAESSTRPAARTATTRGPSRCRACSSRRGPRIHARHRGQAVPEHSHLRFHVRGARPPAGEERRRSRRDPRYAPLTHDNFGSHYSRRLEDRSARQPRRHPRVLRLRHLRRVREGHRRRRCSRRPIRSSR